MFRRCRAVGSRLRFNPPGPNGYFFVDPVTPMETNGGFHRGRNLDNDFSGFLFFIASSSFGCFVYPGSIKLYLEKSDDDDDSFVAVDSLAEEETNKDPDAYTWVVYIPFGSLRNTLWWQHHTSSTAIQIRFKSFVTIHGCGCIPIPKRSETTTTTTSITHSDSSSSSDNKYYCKLDDLRDSKSTLQFCIRPYNW